jgi:hypothetical protein
MKLLVLAAIAGSAMAFGAAALPVADDPCFLTRDLRGHTVGTDGHTLYFNVNGRDTYRVTTNSSCLAHATASDTLLLKDRGLGKICRSLDLELIIRGNHCVVDNLTKLTPAEAIALPKKLQP